MTSWPYNDRPPGFTLPDYGLAVEEQAELTGRIWSTLVCGSDDVEDFVDSQSGDWELTDEQLREAFELALRTRLEQQAGWTEEDTVTNLDRAFNDLEEIGILAMQDFTCCANCGAAEIGGERDDSRQWRGYVFFHQQDTESLVDGGMVYLSYGAFPPEDFDREAYEKLSDKEKTAAAYAADVRAVTEDMLPVLRQHGLEVVWDGSLSTRILLRGAQWYAPLDLTDLPG